MKTTDPEVIALAETWAAIDGKLHKFSNEEKGYREGYLEDAKYLIECLHKRGFSVVSNWKLVT